MTPEEIKAMRDKIEKEEREKAEKGIALERSRTAEIRAIGKKHKMEDEADTAIEKGTASDAFRTLALDTIAERAAAPVVIPGTPTEPAEAKDKFRNLGENYMAIINATTGRHYDKRLGKRAVLGSNEGVGSEGGFAVQTDLSSDFIQKMTETGILASRCRNVTISSASNSVEFNALDETSRATGSRFGGIRAYRVAEAESITASQPKIKKIKLELSKLAGVSYLTEEVMADTTLMESLTREAFLAEFGWVTDNEIFRGLGGAQMLGLLNSPALISVAAEVGQAADTIEYENIVKMWARLYSGSKANAVWIINQDITPQLQTMSLAVGTGGVPVYMPAGGASAAPFGTLYGRPILEIEQASTLGTIGDISLVDLSEYMVANKGGVNESSSIHVQFLTDQTALKVTIRNGGRPMWDSALTPANGSNTTSPFVALATRS